MGVDTGPQRAYAPAGARTIDGPGGDLTIVEWPNLIEVHYTVPLTDDQARWVHEWLAADRPAWEVKSFAFTRDGLVGIVTITPPN